MKQDLLRRDALIQLLTKRISALKDGYRQNVALIGHELMGKTGLVLSLLDSYYDPRTILIYIPVRPEPLPLFARRFIGVVLYAFLINSGTPLKEDLDFLLTEAGRYIPQTCEKIRTILQAIEKRKLAGVFTDLLSLCDSIHQETGKCGVVIFDEFHNLERLGQQRIYAEWTKLIVTQKTTLYLIVSSRVCKARTILAKDLSLLFGNFETVTVEPFSVERAELFLNGKLKGLAIPVGIRDFLNHFTGGIPFYLDTLTQALLKTGERTVTGVLEELLLQPMGLFHQRFAAQLKLITETPCAQEYLAILRQVAAGTTRIKDIAHLLRKTKRELLKRVDYLWEEDYLTRSGDFLTFNDRVFGFWLHSVYEGQLKALTFNGLNQKAAFAEKINAMIAEFLKQAQRPLIERMTELLHLFCDETVQLDRRKFKLDHFREVKPVHLSGRSLKEGVIGRSEDGVWLLALNTERLTEDDISDFSRECRKHRNKLQRKILVTLQDLDSNTSLRAMQEKIWTWNMENVNRLCDLYAKPRIIAAAASPHEDWRHL